MSTMPKRRENGAGNIAAGIHTTKFQISANFPYDR